MFDPTDGGTEPGGPSTPPAGGPPTPPPGFAGFRPTPPPGFAGGPPNPAAPPSPGTPPPGFAGPGPRSAASLGQVAAPPVHPAASASAAKGGGAGKFIVALLVIVALGAGAFFFVSSKDDDGSGSSGSVAAPAVPVLAWATAMEEQDFDAACEVMAEEALVTLETGSATCESELERLSADGQYAKGSDSKVLEVVTKGDRARVTMKFGGSPLPKQSMLAIREDGTWKVNPFSFGTNLDPPPDSTVPGGAKIKPGGPAEAFQDFTAAIASRDTYKACALLSAAAHLDIRESGKECGSEISRNAPELTGWPEGAAITVTGETINGARAEVTYKIGNEVQTKPAVMVKEGLGWMIDLFAESSGLGNGAGAQTSACSTEQQVVTTAIEAYFAQNGEYPPDAQALVGDFLQKLPPNSKVNPDGTVTMTGECA